MTITEIAKSFSNGKFRNTYLYLDENIEWTVVEENKFIGKDAVIQNCEEVGAYFSSVTTDFKTLNVIVDRNKVVINGTAEFRKDNRCVAFVSACDIYEFNDRKQIRKITSYCISSR